MRSLFYTVRQGDCLWDLAARYLGSPWEWPRIYSYNNRESIIKLTGKGIKDPDLIYPGQVLCLPVADRPPIRMVKKQNGHNRPESLKNQLKTIMMPFIMAYKLDDLPLMFYEDAFIKATIKLSGKVAIRLADKVPLIETTNRGVETKLAMQAENELKALFYETKVALDKNTNKITYQSLIVAHSGLSGGPSTALGLAVSSDSPVPVLRGEIRYPQVFTGRINQHYYTAADFRVVIEVQPKIPPIDNQSQKMANKFQYKETQDLYPSHSPSHSDGLYGWKLAGAAALFLTATIATDFVFGLGILDDLATIPASLAMMGRGLAQIIWPTMIRNTATLAAGQGAGMALKAAH